LNNLQIDAEDVNRDALLQFFALHLLQGLLERGIVQGKQRKLLTPAEQRLVEEARSKGLMSFEDAEVEAAILWCASGCGLKLDEDRLRKFLGTAH
jgi:homoaconitase/3-isopropylmalate dehydratase large subunit